MNNEDISTFPKLEKYIGYMQAIRGRSPLTLKEYKYDLVMFFRFLIYRNNGKKDDTPFNQISINHIDDDFLRSVKLEDIYSFITYLSVEKKSSPATRSRKIASLRSFFNYLKSKERILQEDPTVELESPKQVRRLPRYLTLQESKNLLNASAQRIEANPEDKNAERDFCIITLFLNCGLRLSELVNINIKDINEDTLKVLGKGSKERTIYLNTACIKAISDWLVIREKIKLKKDKDALFVSRHRQRISAKQVQLIIKKHMEIAGIDTTRYSTHKLRHTAATLMYKYGKVDIRSLQQILGHESISTTEIYTHVDNEQLHNAVQSNPLATFEK